MLATELREQVNLLEKIVQRSNDTLLSGSWAFNVLYNKKTLEDCQIIEAYDRDGRETFMLPHRHSQSKEVFYQVRGSTTFDDGSVLNIGEIKVIPPGVIHSACISPGGACIVIVHPCEPAYVL